MKRPRARTSIIGIGDSPEIADQNAWDVRTAQARVQTMAKLIAGHAVEIVSTNDPKQVVLRVGDVEFSDLREEYPSEGLVARIALAVDAARFNADAFKIPDFTPEDLDRFDPLKRLDGLADRMHAELDLAETADNNVRRVSRRGMTSAERHAGDVKW